MATGRPAQLDGAQLDALRGALLQGAMAHGFGTELWTLKRVRALIESAVLAWKRKSWPALRKSVPPSGD